MENSKKEFAISTADSGDYFFLLNSPTGNPIEYDFMIAENASANLYFYVFSPENSQKYIINILHGSHSKSNCSVVTFASGTGNVSLTINSVIKAGSIAAKSNQLVDGIILSKKSSIRVTPSMLIDCEKTNATHSVNIGMLNPEKIFYLESRGIPTVEAKKILLESYFFPIKNAKSKQVKCLYNKVMQLFNSALVS